MHVLLDNIYIKYQRITHYVERYTVLHSYILVTSKGGNISKVKFRYKHYTCFFFNLDFEL